MFNYYDVELKRLENSENLKSVKVYDGLGHSTNQLDLNTESIVVLIEFLNSELERLKRNE